MAKSGAFSEKKVGKKSRKKLGISATFFHTELGAAAAAGESPGGGHHAGMLGLAGGRVGRELAFARGVGAARSRRPSKCTTDDLHGVGHGGCGGRYLATQGAPGSPAQRDAHPHEGSSRGGAGGWGRLAACGAIGAQKEGEVAFARHGPCHSPALFKHELLVWFDRSVP